MDIETVRYLNKYNSGHGGLGSSVGIGTGYELDRPWIESR